MRPPHLVRGATRYFQPDTRYPTSRRSGNRFGARRPLAVSRSTPSHEGGTAVEYPGRAATGERDPRSASPARRAMTDVEAEPYTFEFDPPRTALLMIDFQRDFVEPGGL